MEKVRSLNRQSQTAMLTAFYRAVACQEYGKTKLGADYMAEHFLPLYARILMKSSRIRSKSLAKHNLRLPGVFEYVLARTVFFDQIFADALKGNIPQIVLLGAGYDTRAYRFAELNQASQIIEVDRAATQERKRKILKKLGIKIPGLVTYASADFNRESLKEVLHKAGYQEDRRALFVWEGVSMYLEAEAVDAILRFVAHSSHGQSVIAFDYVINVLDPKAQESHGAAEISRTMQRPRSPESFKFTIDPDVIESFLRQRGLAIVQHQDDRRIGELYRSHAPADLAGRPNGSFRLVMVSPSSPHIS